MSVKRLKPKQRGPWCGFCIVGERERAEWVGFGHAKFSCDRHKPDLMAWDRRESAPDYSDAAFSLGGKI